jgi:AraC family ethanolamine operon transcriptional activator
MAQFFLKENFTDYDAFSHAIKAWNLDFRQLDIGPLQADVFQFGTASSLFGHARFSRRFDQQGAAPSGFYTFAIFTQKSSPVVWHGQEISNNTIVVYKPGSEIDCISRPGFEVFTLSYKEKYLNEICSKLGLPEIRVMVISSDNFECRLPDLAQCHNQLNQIIDAMNCHSYQIDNSGLMHNLNVNFPEQILLALAGSQPPLTIAKGLRSRAIKRIKEHLSGAFNESVSLSQLCSIAGVSERTLQYTFKEHYGISPKKYLNNYRLNNVRRELWKSDPDLTRVNDIASLWGFWHMGQFAADYRKLFGELPSETLQRKCD